MKKSPLYLKCIFEDGLVFFKITILDQSDEDYIYDGTEVIYEENTWSIDHYELTQEDVEEMYRDDFFNISKEEYEEAYKAASLYIK